MKNLPVARKLMVVFGALLVVIVTICATGALALWSVETRSGTVGNLHVPNMADSQQLHAAMAGYRAAEFDRIVATTPPEAAGADARLKEARQNIALQMKALDDRIGLPDTQALFDKFAAAVRVYDKDDAHMATLARALKEKDAIAVARAARGHFDDLAGAASALANIERSNAEEASAQVTRISEEGIWGTILLMLLGVAVVIFALMLLIRLIARPLAQMTDAMVRLAAGDYGVAVSDAERGDEVGALARAMAAFRDRLQAAEAAEAAQAHLIVDSIGTGLDSLAQGDLTAEIRTDLAGPFAPLKANFNIAVAGLRGLMDAVKDSAGAIRIGAGEIAQASEDLARRTEANAASLEETAAAVTQMSGRLRDTAEAATRTVSRADEAIGTVGSGRAIADEAVQAMGRVSESAQGIDDVIEGLDKIAFQTRVLAMNAAVEAGRAGEAGRGFAVVADLVSALAMRAEEEAKRAREQLTVTQAEIVSAVGAVERVDGAFSTIAEGVGEVHKLLNTMAADNAAQARAVDEINNAVGAMDQSTQQNAAMVEETSAAARNLAQEIDQLEGQASRFGTGQPMPMRPPIAQLPAARPVARKTVAVALPIASASNGADNWASF